MLVKPGVELPGDEQVVGCLAHSTNVRNPCDTGDPDA